jgi:hypothetical protein
MSVRFSYTYFRCFSFLTITFYASVVNGQFIKPLRFDEDYSFLLNDTSKKSIYTKLKAVPLNSGKTFYVTFGGEVRYQYNLFRNEEWGDLKADKKGFILIRHMLHSDVHLGKQVRLFAQVKANFEEGRANGPRIPIDEDHFSLHQLFADVHLLKQRSKKDLFLRAGRQELMYGSQRLIATREGPNNRQNFDAIKMVFKSAIFQSDILFANPIQTLPGALDDKRRNDIDLYIAYFVFNKVPVINNADVYFIGLEKTTSRFNEGTASEKRYSLGTRIWGSNKACKYDAEAVFQVGKFGNENINAYTASLHTDYTFRKWKIKMLLGLKTEIISGDKVKGDGKLESFNPLFPRGAYFGFPALVGPANLIDVHPYVQIPVTPKFRISGDYDLFWRHKTEDGIYGPVGNFIRGDNGSKSRFIGQQATLQLEMLPNKHLYMAAEFAYFTAGSYLKESGNGENTFLMSLTTTLKF